jgi:hypothetical protein
MTGDIKTQIRNKATINAYHKYVSRKYGWTDGCVQLIHWQALAAAAKKSNTLQKNFNARLMHGWLPTRGHPGFVDVENPTKMCPFCLETLETNQHFLQCKKQQMGQIQELFHKLNTKLPQAPVQTTLATIIRQILLGEEVIIPEEYGTIGKEQDCIGWQHVPLGRLATSWSKQYELESNNNNADDWLANIIYELWNYNRKKWEDRCTKAHEKNETTIKDNTAIINHQIEDLYSQYDNLDSTDKRLLHTPLAEQIKMTLQHKIDWVQRTKPLICKGIKRNKTQIRRNNHTILQFFRPSKKSSGERDTSTRAMRENTKQNNAPATGVNRYSRENFRPP